MRGRCGNGVCSAKNRRSNHCLIGGLKAGQYLSQTDGRVQEVKVEGSDRWWFRG